LNRRAVMDSEMQERRDFLKFGVAGLSSALLITACGKKTAPVNTPAANAPQNAATPAEKKADKHDPDAKEVEAVEDLMREHGILRRALLVYGEAALRFRKNADVSPEALKKTANLFRTFGEDYHEKKLEEAFIFPRIKEKAPGTEAANYVDILIEQHNRGREITDYILSVVNGPKISAEAAKFADVLESFVRMYEHHAAREDTIIFPAWKDAVTPEEFDDLSDKFEDIEYESFGEDGFETTAKQMSEIEASLNLSDLAQFTAPAPIPS
jgi:hemerythrin-like domain-containing protein